MGGPGAIAEVAFDAGEAAGPVLAAWRLALTAALDALGWPVELHIRQHDDGHGHPGADLVFAAPPDHLYLATDINDWAIQAANATTRDAVGAAGAGDPARQLPAWRETIAHEQQPRVAALRTAAAARDLPILADDDELTIGHGRRAVSYPARLPPPPEAVPWDSLGRVPIALITGTNGKTTTARLLARIALKAGFTPGNTSTDGMSVAERPLEAGDWTGPSAARTVLRHPEVDLAVLEVARGGILRRGLGVDRCDAAAVLNVSADHLGEYGIHDLAAMASVKAVVGSIVAPHGRVVLGAESPPLVDLVARGHRFPAAIAWFARDEHHPTLAAHLASGGEAWFVSATGRLTRGRGDHRDELVAIAELPFCFGGAASHNVRNALAAAALASALGLPDPAIVAGLRSFHASVSDNPGRANLAIVAGVQVFLDFAHNPDGIRSLHGLLTALRGPRRLLLGIGVAGDRSDETIRDLARAAHELAPDQVIVRDLEHYLRGREPGEVPALLRDELIRLGHPASALTTASDEVDLLRRGLAWAEPGDLVAILVHVERDEIQAELRRLGAIADPGPDPRPA
ncbi:MAG: Mur ligase [Nannocystis sp.]|uniref:Mur ligase family protein n=1 Tax=Nannocystis sp. TaxID=1962667 RepID=UPI002422ABC9|nr:Mur ligase family protein [Nannocystis sp.]MBK9756674.1 Mur ligase [Nannocystis sp.]